MRKYRRKEAKGRIINPRVQNTLLRLTQLLAETNKKTWLAITIIKENPLVIFR